MTKKFETFINQYKLSKTLKFELRPIGNTAENIQNKHLLEKDNDRADDYKKVKKIIDEYHKQFIENALVGFEFEDNDLQEYYENYKNNLSKKYKEEKDIKGIENAFKYSKEKLREAIVNRFKKNEYNKLFSKDLIEKDLLEMGGLDENNKAIINNFKGFTTYFGGFHENRQNMYSHEEKPTAIAYRLINENLPKFIENMGSFEKIIKSSLKDDFDKIISELGSESGIEKVEDAFVIGFFNRTLTQKGIDNYNLLLGGKTLEEDVKIKGLNEYINLYNQQLIDKKDRQPRLKPLYKQILSDSQCTSFRLENIDSDSKLLEQINAFYKELKLTDIENLLSNLNNKDYDLDKIYIKNDTSITEIAKNMFADWGVIKDSIASRIKNENECGKKTEAKYDEYIEKEYIKNKVFSIKFINDCLAEYGSETIKSAKIKTLEVYFSSNIAGYAKAIEDSYSSCKNILKNAETNEDGLKQDKEKVAKIKNLLDSIKDLQKFIKPLVENTGEASDKDVDFYNHFNELCDMLGSITNLYNQARNYLTKKPYSIDKIKLNFENPTLLKGWAKDMEIPNSCSLFVKNGLYYLGVYDKVGKSKIEFSKPITEDDNFEKMEYLQAADPSKDIQNLMVIDGKTVKKNGRKDENGINKLLEELKEIHLPKEINKIRKAGTYSKVNKENFEKEDLIKFIDFYKERAIAYWADFKFTFKASQDYDNFGEFTDHVNQQAYQINFIKVSKKCVDKLVEDGKLYLFQIYNKDFSVYSKGTPNLHTLYWKMLFDKENLKNVVYKLNGEAEIFYRRASLKIEKPTHPKGKPIENKNKDNPKKYSEFDYDIIKDKRYTNHGNIEGRFFFHVPITMNFKANGKDNINEAVNEHLKKSNDFKIIGIDRGERHLLYISIIDSTGKLIEQESFNIIENYVISKEYNNKFSLRTNYHDILNKKESERKESRLNWDTINSIKEIKEGYLSQVIHKIAQLMIQHNAIIVLEDLNSGFKNSRVKFEKQVYQKFEKMLIDKLNYLVFKTNNVNELGGLLNAYQLSNKFESFEKMGKQNGFLFYVPAWNTSKICPVTGFVSSFIDTKFQNKDKAIELLNKFEEIRFNQAKDYFEFVIENHTTFNSKADGTRQKWTICTYKDRIENFKNQDKNNSWDTKKVNLSEAFKTLFNQYNIHYRDDLKNQILDKKDINFLKSILYLLKLTLQIRNSSHTTGDDYIISPVCDKYGNFFDSRDAKDGLPKDADANGAYNIARKGLWLVEQIKTLEDFKKIPTMNNKTWLDFTQKSDS